jgi:hydroxymethylpyrimidine/phosphomethylpyrimidine kinase
MIRSPNPETPPYALTVASTDSGGGAGIAADLKTMTRLGVYGGCVVVSVTAQNTRGVRSTHVLPPAEVRAQFDAVTADFEVGAIKTGMLATEAGVEVTADQLAGHDAPAVVDPVMVSTAGDVLLEPGAIDAYDDVFAEATVVTPNAEEAAELTGIVPDSEAAAADAATTILDTGADAVLLKGGHIGDDDEVVDRLVTADGVTSFVGERVSTERTHGSGCTLSSAIAAQLAHGNDLRTAVRRGIDFTQAALSSPADVGDGPGSVNHLIDLENTITDGNPDQSSTPDGDR